MNSLPEPPFAPELAVEEPPHLPEEPVSHTAVRPWTPAPAPVENIATVGRLGARDLGHTLLLQAAHTPLSERASWPGPAWAVVGELVSVSHRQDSTSLVLRVAGSEMRLDVAPALEVGRPPQSRIV